MNLRVSISSCQFPVFQFHSSDFNKLEIPQTDTTQQKKKCSETSILKWLSYILKRPPSNAQQVKAKLSHFLTCSSTMLLHRKTTNTLPFEYLLNFAKQNVWYIELFPKHVGRFERMSWPAKSDSTTSICSGFKTYIFGSETKLLQDVRH